MITKTTQSAIIPAAIPTSTVTKFGTCSGTVVTSYPAYSTPAYRKSVESITYSPRGFGRLNPCNHTKIELWFSTGPAIGTGSPTNPPSGCSSTESWSGSLGALSYPWSYPGWPSQTYDDVNWRSYSSEAVRKMWPEVESLLSTLNFTYELPQVKRILPDILRLTGLSRQSVAAVISGAAASGSRGAFKALGKSLLPVKMRKHTLQRISKEMAGHPLNSVQKLSSGILIYNYAIKPLLQDISALSQVYSHASRQLTRLVTGQNRVHRSYYSRMLDVPRSVVHDAMVWDGGGQGSYRAARDYTSEIAKYTAVMDYSWKIPEMSPATLKLFAFLDALGIQANPEIIWDAIPYSFVVDWFLGVSDYLNTFKVRNIEPEVTVHGFMHSYKRKYMLKQDIFLRADRTPSYGRFPVKSEKVSAYYREPYAFVLDPIMGVKKLTTLKVVLGSALIGARIH